MNNSIVKIYKNGFNGTNLKTIKLSIDKLTIEDVCSLKESLKPVIIKSFAHISYYDPINIENRNDIDCTKTLIFLRSKIFYNFLNEHIDFNTLLHNCQNISKIKNEMFNYKC